MVAFLLQTTSSEDLRSEDSSWPTGNRTSIRCSSVPATPQERLVMERPLVCNPHCGCCPGILRRRRHSAASGLLQRRPNHSTQYHVSGYCSGRTDVYSESCHISCTTIFPVSFQGPVKSAPLVTGFVPRLSKGHRRFLDI